MDRRRVKSYPPLASRGGDEPRDRQRDRGGKQRRGRDIGEGEFHEARREAESREQRAENTEQRTQRGRQRARHPTLKQQSSDSAIIGCEKAINEDKVHRTSGHRSSTMQHMK